MSKMLRFIALSLAIGSFQFSIGADEAEEQETVETQEVETQQEGEPEAQVEELATEVEDTQQETPAEPEEQAVEPESSPEPEAAQEETPQETPAEEPAAPAAPQVNPEEQPEAAAAKEEQQAQAADTNEQADEPGSPQWKEDSQDDTEQQDAQAQEVQAVPEEPQAEAQEDEQPQEDDGEVMGIDTVSVSDPQGNWLYKRVWWERAEAKFEKIRETVNKVLEFRTDFFAKRAELDKNVLDPFYIKIGISQGELQEILKELTGRVEKLLASATNDSIIEKAEEDKKGLVELQKQVEKVMSQDQEVDAAIGMLVEQITKIRNLEQQAWQDFKGIARVLDDRKARELFYKVDAAWRSIKDLQEYIEQAFAGKFDQLIAKVKEEIQRIDQEMSALKESGVNLQQRLLSTDTPAQEEDEEEELEERGFFSRWVIDPIASFFRGIWSIVTWPFEKIFGAGSADDEMIEEEVDDEQVAVEPSESEEQESAEPEGEAEAAE